MTAETISISADAAAGASIPSKREMEGAIEGEPPSKVAKTDVPQSEAPPATTDVIEKQTDAEKALNTRKTRLEQNRKAAKESRRRKKVMIEELQRSVIFFSRANSALKQHNDELMHLVIQAQSMISSDGDQKVDATKTEVKTQEQVAADGSKGAMEQAEAEAVATQALYESQGFSAAAARQAAQTMKGSGTTPTSADSAIPDMQTGATMQAMASFQQAATAAMQAAMQGINHAIPGVSMSQLAATPAGANAQQAYTDTMTALAMQQAAAAAAGQQFGMQPFMANPMFAWQQAFATSTTPVTPAPASAPNEEESVELTDAV